MESAIAIVGMACHYPDAKSPQELWENALSQRKAFRRIPPDKFRLEDYYHPQHSTPDSTYSTQGAFLTGYEFDRVRFRISGTAYRSSDMAHWLALDIATQALEDAGFAQGHDLPTISTGVLVGNTLTGEFSRANSLRLRWPYVSRVVSAELQNAGWSVEECRAFLQRLEQAYKAPFAPVGEETLAGSLSNTIAGRICNYFNLQGGGYTVDGACASSLLAVSNACTALVARDIDVGLVGGVDISIDPFEIIGFAKATALTEKDMRVFDEHSSGFLPGEGCGFVVLMRYEDAIAQQRRIYALIRGWGISSDGSGGITRPETEGQQIALTRAYQRAGFGIDTVTYFECHGTGTSVGDATELQTLTAARKQAGSSSQRAVIGSVKANIGHTKAAAGVAGLIKTATALAMQVIPPTSGTINPHREITRKDAELAIAQRGMLWPHEAHLRAGVSAMGFGGINAHLVLESASPTRRTALTAREQQLLSSAQDVELLLLSGQDAPDLLSQIEQLQTIVEHISLAELGDLASSLASRVHKNSLRAGLVCKNAEELGSQLHRLKELIAQGQTQYLDSQAGLFIGTGERAPRIGFLFPGQGSPTYLSGGAFRRRFSSAEYFYQQARLSPEQNEKNTRVAQPAIITHILAGLHLLEELNISADIGIGHSLGELAALYWARVYDAPTVVRIATMRGQAMAELTRQTGSMVSIAGTQEQVQTLIGDEPVALAGINAPHQTVISGEVFAVNRVAARARAQGFKCTRLPVSHAFHSPLVQEAAQALRAYLASEQFAPPQRNIFSTVTGNLLTETNDLKDLLYQQITQPVHFLKAVLQAQEQVDLFVEVGPGNILSGLTGDISSVPTLSMDIGSSSLRSVLSVIAAAYALGAPVRPDVLFKERFNRPFDSSKRPQFLVNPCEQEPLTGISLGPQPEMSREGNERPADTQLDTTSALSIVQQLIAARAELPNASIQRENRLLSDLHLNSITVGQIIADACRQMGLAPSIAPTDYADATVQEVAQALEELQRTGSLAPKEGEQEVAGLYPWVYPFEISDIEAPLPTGHRQEGKGDWQLFTPPGYPYTLELQEAFTRVAGQGTVVCLPEEKEEECLSLLLQAIHATLHGSNSTHFVLIQHGKGAGSVARTLHLERPGITVCVLNIPANHPQTAQWAAQETAHARGYVEVKYNRTGNRSIPVLRKLMVPQGQRQDPLSLSPHDVLLVSGGGKGIAAECAFALAQETGIQLALMGRSHPEQDSALADNLRRMRDAGIRYRYQAVDVCDASSVQKAVQQFEIQLGRITGILHGAGANTPALLSVLDEAAFKQTLAPKIAGLQNILKAVTTTQLRLVVTFGSVIARTGMRGEADYALANEWLGQLTEAFQQAHPACHCLCIEWSVWSGVGMGERLGRVDALKREGITPITPDKGIQLFRQLLDYRGQSSRIVVSGRFGNAPTLSMEKPSLPFLRFLEEIKMYYPGIELIAQAELSTSTDLYLDDHQVQGERLLPAVVGLEAMAQAAQAVTGETCLPIFEHIQFIKPLVIPAKSSSTLRIIALVHASGKVELAIRSKETAFQLDHFKAWCTFSENPEVALSPLSQLEQVRQTDQVAIPLDPHKDLYGSILFHRGRFTRLKGYRHLCATECIADIHAEPIGEWFARYLPTQLVLGDAALHDTVIHAIQACIPQATLLPTAIEALRLRSLDASRTHTYQTIARERSRQETHFIYDIEVQDETGEIYEQWIGLHLQQVQATVSPEQWAVTLFGPYLERRVGELIPGVSIRVTLQDDTSLQESERSRQALFSIIGASARALHKRPDGKLLLADQVVSTAHAGNFTLAVSGSVPLSCDLVRKEEKTAECWQDLLGMERYHLALLLAKEGHDDLNTAATHVWAAGECLKKIGALPDAPLVLTTCHEDGWQQLASGPFLIVTYATRPGGEQQPIIFAFGIER
ncbi:type I polyketide synthase [Ktedonobacter robiniae]|uniref:Polyketide synthase n=1 Tax=Ktedonobacter robiniae TaxID=2778365 RepID=A0ABQ3V4W8_9CHLR|nr:type I polyketide synthase [Ktedonobacter robiniae]GHO59998.1 polyketide synthase [Ktedonobacter robiniae]